MASSSSNTLEFGVMTFRDIHLLLEGLDRTNDVVIKTTNHIIYEAVNKILRPALEEKIRQTGVAVDNSEHTHPNGKTHAPLIQGVETYLSTNADKSKTGWISILGNRDFDDGTWRLRFYEVGTAERHNRRTGQSYGSLEAHHFFIQTIDEKTSEVLAAIKDNIDRLKIKLGNNQ